MIRAVDPSEDLPRFEVEKTFSDQNGGKLRKGDLVTVTVSMIPIGGSVGPVSYWEQLAGPWIIYKDEYNKIVEFDYGDIPIDAEFDRNVSN